MQVLSSLRSAKTAIPIAKSSVVVVGCMLFAKVIHVLKLFREEPIRSVDVECIPYH